MVKAYGFGNVRTGFHALFVLKANLSEQSIMNWTRFGNLKKLIPLLVRELSG